MFNNINKQKWRPRAGGRVSKRRNLLISDSLPTICRDQRETVNHAGEFTAVNFPRINKTKEK